MNEVTQAAIATLGDITRVHASRRPGARALVFENRTTSFQDLDSRSNQVANGLIAAGLGCGDRIAYLGKNSDVYFEILFGAAKAGIVLTPINWRLAGPEVAYVLADCGAKMLFAGAEFSDLVQTAVAWSDAILTIEIHNSSSSEGYVEWRDSRSSRDPGINVPPASPVVQLYTSGTTGHPKGAVLSHANFIWLQRAQGGERFAWNMWRSHDVTLVVMPTFHIAGLSWALTALYNGSPVAIVGAFSPSGVLQDIAELRVTKLLLVPAAVQMLLSEYEASPSDLSSLQYIMYGASPIPLDLLRACMRTFGVKFVQFYGMTETTGGVIALEPEDHDPAGNERMQSAGRALPGVDVAIWSPDGQPLPGGELGEIVLRSGANMLGYWNKPEATAQTLTAEGWLRTGDAGYIDADGYVFIKDRLRDMIISGGENVYPAEVESAIFGHPDVADVAVIGIPSKRWGEEVKGIVVPREGSRPDAQAIIAWTSTRIARFKVPKSIDFVAALPRTASGKILRRALRAPYWEGLSNSATKVKPG